jgi:hypothetical protein
MHPFEVLLILLLELIPGIIASAFQDHKLTVVLGIPIFGARDHQTLPTFAWDAP